MSDWSDEAAEKVCVRFFGDWTLDETEGVAAALRQARLDALEEAARAIVTSAPEDCDCSECNLQRSLAKLVRSLKERQP